MPGTIGTIIVGMGATALTLGFVTNGAYERSSGRAP
jgi:hypothetical protein